MQNIKEDYLLNQQIKMYQKQDSYKTSSDAVLLSSMVEDIKDGAKILDVGSGTGGISLCLAHRFNNVQIKGLEIQSDLVCLANLSAKENRFFHLEYLCYDIKQKSAPFPFCSFDHIVTNPPYEKNGTKSPNKSKALAHNQDNISLQDWLQFCIKMLKPFGFLYLIHRAEALEEILNIFHQKLGHITIVPIYSKEGQNAKRIMIKAQKDSKSPLQICPPLIIHQNGAYSAAAHQILREGKSLSEI